MGSKKMDVGSLTIIVLMFFKELLTGSTQYTPKPCTLEGDFSLLTCPLGSPADLKDSQNPENIVKWFRMNETHGLIKLSPEINSRIVVNGDNLEFWPAEVNDTGDYFCVHGNSTRNVTSKPLTFSVSKINKKYCFNTVCTLKIPQKRGIATAIPCGVAEKFTEFISIVWYKGCDFYKNISVLYFGDLKDEDAGNYSCVIKRAHEGKEYNYIKTFQLVVEDNVEIVKPHILGGDVTVNETTEIGKPKTLSCTAFTGYYKENEMSLFFYWIKIKMGDGLNGQTAHLVKRCPKKESEMPCAKSEKPSFSDGKNYMAIEMQFQNVKEEDLEYKYICKMDHSFRIQIKTFILRKKEQTRDITEHTFTTWMILAIVSTFLFLMLAVVCLIFRIEITLSYRRVTRKDETKSDGKEYDAYVSFLKYSMLDAKAERHFALDILSHILEEHFGYKLCIFERDVMPGGAIVDEVNSCIDKSRRLIIILSKNYMSDIAMYELESGLYKSLVERKIKVILIEYNLQGDIQLMPESLDLLKSSSKVRWTEGKSRPLNSRFWKKMQYLMPAKPLQSSSPASVIPVFRNMKHSAEDVSLPL